MLLWPVALALKYGRDPVVWLALAVVLALRPSGLYRLLRVQAGRVLTSGLRVCVAGTS